ncbi:MAG: alpha/beta fold hydrolase [Bacteroidales bacterium]
MRSVYCSVLPALAVALGVTLGATGAAPRGATRRPAVVDESEQAPGPNTADFKIFMKGRQVGTEEVSVARTPTGTVIAGRGRLSAPLDIETNRCEVRYDAEWRPIEANFDAIVHGQYTLLHTEFANGTATTQMAQAGQQANRTAKVSADAVVLLNAFFGLYEALAARLASLQPGGTIPVFILPQQELSAQFKSVSDEKIQTPGKTIATRHYVLSFVEPTGPSQVDIWTDENHRLVHLAVPAQSFDMLRSDIATVSARREVASRPGDEQVQFPGNGFSLAGTVSRPAAAVSAKPGAARFPAVVLVAGSGQTDRDEYVFNIPIFAQVADALADAGFIVLRYDKRGVGQSGGRADAATLDEYADDVRAAVKYLQGRKDVDEKGIVVAGYREGGWAAMLAAAKNKDVAALVLVATPGVPGAELVLAQQRHQLAGMKLTAAEQQARIDPRRRSRRRCSREPAGKACRTRCAGRPTLPGSGGSSRSTRRR